MLPMFQPFLFLEVSHYRVGSDFLVSNGECDKEPVLSFHQTSLSLMTCALVPMCRLHAKWRFSLCGQ